ncbi:hypothetical protein DQ04_00271230 [Trypanosoma grayi]|uniref:hypothetical protein n=1 Tax=Trypanosoma grayi TaxID=71804 RepID=UPI0004F4A733|nr:hypothetical protein DQ04_00271230 [Trypanosoma grayi]KEG14889.1 hypothetical protein DQ04_00271230 [Trypanosoma grayi]
MSSKRASKSSEKQPSKEVQGEVLSEHLSPIWKHSKGLGVSGMLGAAVGVATKRLTKDALYGAGLAVIALQSLSTLGYIQINWKKMEEKVTQVADQNKDGKLDVNDVKILLNRAIQFCSRGLSDAGGFATGFFLGMKYLA